MPDTAKRAGPTLLTASAATIYTVTTGATGMLRNIHVANETGSDATLTVSIGTDGSGKRLYRNQTVTANGSLDWSGFIVMNSTEVLQAFSGTASALTITVSVVEAS